MMLDLQTLFSDKQALTTGTVVSTNSLDLGAPQAMAGGVGLGAGLGAVYGNAFKDVGRGEPVDIFILVNEDFASGTSLQVNFIQSANADLSSPDILMSSAVILEAALKAGYQFRVGAVLPTGINKRYIGLQLVNAGTHTTGKITGGIATRGGTDQNYAPL